jgi:hypothetical protein
MSLNLNLRSQLGRKLTINELDDNFSNIENAINSGGSSSQNEVKAHSSLTQSDIGKFVMSYTDPSWTEWVINGGTISGFTGSISEARVVYLGGTTSGQNGKWTLDFSETYGGENWDSLSGGDIFLEILTNNNSVQIKKYNLQFQSEDPYLSTIVDSLTYSLANFTIGTPPLFPQLGTYSVTTDPTSLAILFEYYVNNGIPYLPPNAPGDEPSDNIYTADGRFGNSIPYFITQTFSTPFVSATRSGTSVQFEIDKDSETYDVYYFTDTNNTITADVEIIPSNDLAYVEYPVIGVLEDLKDGMAYISPMPEIIEVSPTTGIYSGTQSNIITNLPTNFLNNLELGVLNNWVISGGEDLVNVGNYLTNSDVYFSYITNSPSYTPITTGMVGDKIVFKKTFPLFF